MLDLTKLGYDEPLPAPAPAIQEIVASIVGNEIHKYIKSMDKEALLDKDKDGEHSPLLTETLNLSHWTSMMFMSTLDRGVEKALGHLREAHNVLANLLEKDKFDLQEAITNTRLVEAAL
jgi:hypothetical protein